MLLKIIYSCSPLFQLIKEQSGITGKNVQVFNMDIEWNVFTEEIAKDVISISDHLMCVLK